MPKPSGASWASTLTDSRLLCPELGTCCCRRPHGPALPSLSHRTRALRILTCSPLTSLLGQAQGAAHFLITPKTPAWGRLYFWGAGVEPRVLCTRGRSTTTGLRPRPFFKLIDKSGSRDALPRVLQAGPSPGGGVVRGQGCQQLRTRSVSAGGDPPAPPHAEVQIQTRSPALPRTKGSPHTRCPPGTLCGCT